MNDFSSELSTYNFGLKALLQEGQSGPEFDGDLVYKFRKIVGKTDFSDQFKKKKKKTACILINPVMFDNFASLFNCTTVVGPLIK